MITMIKLQDNQQIVREAFESFYMANFEPNLKRITDYLDVDYASFIKWRKGKQGFGEQNLLKIINFINDQDRSA